jgi:hypothetical protein
MRLLLVRQQSVEILKRRLRDPDRLERGVEPLLHRGDAFGWSELSKTVGAADAANAFVKFLKSPEALPIVKQTGLEPG